MPDNWRAGMRYSGGAIGSHPAIVQSGYAFQIGGTRETTHGTSGCGSLPRTRLPLAKLASRRTISRHRSGVGCEDERSVSKMLPNPSTLDGGVQSPVGQQPDCPVPISPDFYLGGSGPICWKILSVRPENGSTGRANPDTQQLFGVHKNRWSIASLGGIRDVARKQKRRNGP